MLWQVNRVSSLGNGNERGQTGVAVDGQGSIESIDFPMRATKSDKLLMIPADVRNVSAAKYNEFPLRTFCGNGRQRSL